jgi:ABC-type branched-subunit amino acid transport system substrate-binding protein
MALAIPIAPGIRDGIGCHGRRNCLKRKFSAKFGSPGAFKKLCRCRGWRWRWCNQRAFPGKIPAETINEPTGSTVTLGFNVPQSGPYADEGADELRAYELAVEHLNGDRATAA